LQRVSAQDRACGDGVRDEAGARGACDSVSRGGGFTTESTEDTEKDEIGIFVGSVNEVKVRALDLCFSPCSLCPLW
jgi:hypothetical protein